jgi:hypothetical protein
MKCPHCLENFFENWKEKEIDSDKEGIWRIKYCKCPSCKKLIVQLKVLKIGGLEGSSI